MIVLVTDFGLEGPYVGQVLRVLHETAPGIPVVNLFADAPRWNPRATAYLLPAYRAGFPDDTVFLCVVDPGVGSFRSPPVAVHVDGHWFVGPDNGLFEILRRRAIHHETWQIDWRPETLSASFHGRDLYAPIAARLAGGGRDGLVSADPVRFGDFPDQLDEIIYIDRYGNAMTGLSGGTVPPVVVLTCAGHRFYPARTFADLPAGEGLWYVNSNGLVEIAANRASAADEFGLSIGQPIAVA
jgi:hypothetical protein